MTTRTTMPRILLAVCAVVAAALMMFGPADVAHAQGKGKGGGGKQGGAPAPGPAATRTPNPAWANAEVHTLKVQGNVYMIVGPGGNTTVQIGDSGALVVDTQYEEVSDKIVAEIRKLTNKPIRYVVNTSADMDHTDGNAKISRAGAPVIGGNLGAVAFDNGATIVAHENVLRAMSEAAEGKADTNADKLPTTTFFQGQKEIFFNEEPVIIMFEPAAHTNGDSMVFLRRSDVIATGDIFNMNSYPVIEVEKGGNIQGVIKALNVVLDITIPKHEQEGGTYVIPGHGRLTDEHDVLEYRDMVTIVRDRVQNLIKQGKTLAQVKEAKPTFEYDGRWAAASGPGSTDGFVEAVFKSLSAKK
ncbi:MAG: MBL fold metallo-hydrolase [Acidobacteriia bacterium]|nr:MBL fold metallo-hydrolase [Terriglobia bacterium]